MEGKLNVSTTFFLFILIISLNICRFRGSIELAVAVILIPAELLLSVSLIVSVLLVLIIELLSTAVETTVNRISTEQHTLSAKAKDAGSAAVLMASINIVIVWGIVLFDLVFNIS